MITNRGNDPTDERRSASYWIGSLIYDPMRQQAAENLCRIGKPAIPALVNALNDGNNRIREEAAAVLKEIDPEVAEKEGVK
jgi:HEAT repeat protein